MTMHLLSAIAVAVALSVSTTAHAAAARADLSRAVIVFDHAFDDSTRVYG